MDSIERIQHQNVVATYKEFLHCMATGDERQLDIAKANPDLFRITSWRSMGIELGEVEITCPALFTEAVAKYGTEQQRAAILN